MDWSLGGFLFSDVVRTGPRGDNGRRGVITFDMNAAFVARGILLTDKVFSMDYSDFQRMGKLTCRHYRGDNTRSAALPHTRRLCHFGLR